MLFLETVPMKLCGRSRPALKACKDGLPYGSRTLRVSRVEGAQGYRTGSWLKKVSNVKGFKKFQRSEGFGVTRVKGFQGIKGNIFSLSPGHKGNHL